MKRTETFATLFQILMENEETKHEIFETSIGLIQFEAVEKNIEFDGYFRTKWEIEADHPMTFDHEYFEDENRSEMYVYLAALADKDIFDYLNYVWKMLRDENLTENILHREIYFLKEKGVTF